jgi:hypothetical protein
MKAGQGLRYAACGPIRSRVAGVPVGSAVRPRMSAKLFIFSIFLCCCSAAPVSTEADFNLLKALQGSWKIEAERKPLATEMSYDLGSKDSIVTERFGKELSVFYRNGQSVEMVHFCNAGSQPRLRLKKPSEPGVLDFEMFAITNLSTPETPHVQEVIYKVLDANTIKLEIVWWPKARGSEKYTLKRTPEPRSASSQ